MREKLRQTRDENRPMLMMTPTEVATENQPSTSPTAAPAWRPPSKPPIRVCCISVAGKLPGLGAQTRTRPAPPAFLLSDAQTPMAQTAHHQRHRTLLRGGAPPHAPPGLLRQ